LEWIGLEWIRLD